MSDFLDKQNELQDGALFNATKKSPGFKVKRFYLDNLATRGDFNSNANAFLSSFKSFWVCDTNNKLFTAKMVVNPKGDTGDALPLKFNMSIPFKYPVAGCVLEFPSQAGTWIDIAFGTDADITPGFSNVDVSGASRIDEGSSFTDGGVALTSSAAPIFSANSNRKAGLVDNNTGVSVWIGSQSKLNGANYKTDCQRLDSGDPLFYWRNTAALYARVESGTATIPVMEMT
jgi:hypothetical protein